MFNQTRTLARKMGARQRRRWRPPRSCSAATTAASVVYLARRMDYWHSWVTCFSASVSPCATRFGKRALPSRGSCWFDLCHKYILYCIVLYCCYQPCGICLHAHPHCMDPYPPDMLPLLLTQTGSMRTWRRERNHRMRAAWWRSAAQPCFALTARGRLGLAFAVHGARQHVALAVARGAADAASAYQSLF